jgi:hypothetical protein
VLLLTGPFAALVFARLAAVLPWSVVLPDVRFLAVFPPVAVFLPDADFLAAFLLLRFATGYSLLRR